MGKGLNKDFAKAIGYFEAAAAKGDNYAMYNLAGMHLHGDGTPIDLYKAKYWLEK